MKAKRLTVAGIDRVKTPAKGRAEHWDTQAPGLALRVTANGAKSWTLLYRFNGELRRDTLGEPAAMTLTEARTEAQRSRAEARAGTDPRIRRQRELAALQRAQAGTFKKLVDDYDARHARRPAHQRNRSWPETMRILRTYVVPHWGDRPVADITRRDVTELLDKVQDGAFTDGKGRKFTGGAVMADAVLAQVRSLFNWHAARDDTFNSPIVRGMGRAAPPKQRARDRVLNDDEIRLLWKCTEEPEPFPAFVRQALLTGQRRSNVASQDRDAIDAEGVWKVEDTDSKSKRAMYVPLSAMSLALVESQPRIDKSSLVFTTNGTTPISGFSKYKKELDALMLDTLRRQAVERGENPSQVKPIPRWTWHDLRRTARTLMSRARVSKDIAEITTGHKLQGVRAVYDRHDYLEEKRDALKRLAATVERIVSPPLDNVVTFAAGRSG